MDIWQIGIFVYALIGLAFAVHARFFEDDKSKMSVLMWVLGVIMWPWWVVRKILDYEL